MAAPGLGFVTWDDERPSGGNTYDRELVAALRATGMDVAVQALPGTWPVPSPEDMPALTQALDAHQTSLVDGIVASAAPRQIADAVAAGRRVVALVHMAAADEIGLDPAERDRREETERHALQAASAVVATSRTAADDLAARHGLTDVQVARPGVRPAPAAAGSGHDDAPRLLAVGSLTPTKDQATFLHALGRLRDLTWTAHLVGSPDVDPDYAARLRALVDESGLDERAELTGALIGEALETEWAAADLLVLTSRSETFGLVVTEALSRGVPAVVTAGTGAVEALGRAGPDRRSGPAGANLPGCVVPARDVVALAAVLRRWLTDPTLRTALRREALDRRERLPGWDTTAAMITEVLGVG
ncbi:glycosyltransferase family 4 protein [Georgenia halophila]|uniref:Glycosyltransferase family 4 protein n=1 Tax=Georgenia halophila TaxID=620889 RepID=A0ABP8LAI9_9MICO